MGNYKGVRLRKGNHKGCPYDIMKIKICGILDTTSLKGICRLSPAMLGFIFYPPSPRYMAQIIDPETMDLIPSHILRTGVFVNASMDEIEKNILRFGLNMIQLHGDESPSFCAAIQESGIDVIKAFRVSNSFDFSLLKDYESGCKYFLFDTFSKEYGGSGQKFDWEILDSYTLNHPFLLSGGIKPGDEELIMSIKHPSFAGIDLNSGFELEPGRKDIKKLKDFINHLTNNDFFI